MGRRNRKRRPARRKPFKDPKPQILTVTEGKVTEPEYLKGFANATRNPRVVIVIESGAGVPKTVVETAKRLMKEAEKQAKNEKDDNLCYEEVWSVFDIDAHPMIPEARQMARDNNIDLAVSNPCIELWLYLHFADQPGIQHRDTMLKKLKKHIPNYNKHVDFSDYAAGYDKAERRASRLDEAALAANEEGRYPTTGVWRLTRSIRTNASNNGSRNRFRSWPC